MTMPVHEERRERVRQTADVRAKALGIPGEVYVETHNRCVGEILAVGFSDVDGGFQSPRDDRHGRFHIYRYAETAGKVVGGPGGDDPNYDVLARHRVQNSTDGPVTPEGDHEISHPSLAASSTTALIASVLKSKRTARRRIPDCSSPTSAGNSQRRALPDRGFANRTAESRWNKVTDRQVAPIQTPALESGLEQHQEAGRLRGPR